MKTVGSDVSHWEGVIDWQVASNWLPFVYYKCTDGTKYVDNTFKLNKAGCQLTGMPHACYHYYQPGQDPIVQASHYVNTAGEGYRRYIVDVEEEPTDKINFVRYLLLFLQQVEKLTGIKPAIYTSPAFWNENVKPKPGWAKDYELIVAHYTLDVAPILPIGWFNYAIWQFTKTYWFPGCENVADGNWFNGSIEDVRRWFGNYKPAEEREPAYSARSLFDNLHIRAQPNLQAKEIGHLMKGDQVQVYEFEGNDVWVHHDKGWSAVEIDGYRYMEVEK